jgi:rRNA-processing protein FCF1
VAVASAQPAWAGDLSVAKREISASADFRVRMASALALGRSHDPSVRPLLEQALSDPSVAVRTAAAAGLGALGDPAAIPALERARAHEVSASTRAQLESTIATLRRAHAGASFRGVRLIVQIGTMRNSSRVRGADVADVLRNAATSRARSLRHVAVATPSDQALLARAADRHVPVVVLDGSVIRLTRVARSNVVTCQAEVEFVVRKIPDQTLKSTMSGHAAAMGSGTTSARGVASLEDQAIGGAVESALRDADTGLMLAAR